MSGLYPPANGGQHYESSTESVLAEKQPAYYNNPNSVASQNTFVAPAGAGGAAGYQAAKPPVNKRKRGLIIGAAVVGTLVVAGAVVGALFGAKVIKITSNNTSGIAAAAVVTSTNANGQVVTSTQPAAGAAATVSPLPRWDWTKSNMASAAASYAAKETNVQGPMMAAALGNWLVLEQWMSERWFNTSANNNASVIDEWNLMLAAGSNAVSIMKQHYDTWLTEADVDTMQKAGINALRIPIGFWAFINTIPPEPYLTNNQTQILSYVDRLFGWLYARKMYAIIDMHAMPGSQNGEITSGVHTTNPRFYQPAYQQRSRDTMDAVLKYVSTHKYGSVVSAVAPINEPRPYTVEQFNMIRDLYQYTYDQSMKLASPIPVMFHHGFPNFVLNVSYIDYWQGFVANKTKGMIMLEDHPYPGTFPPSSDKASMLRGMCNYISEYKKFGAPVVVTEWSLKTALFDHPWMRQFYTQQLWSWSQNAGGVFWNFKTNNGSIDGGNNTPYSFLDLLNQNIIPQPAAGQNSYQFINSIPSPC